MFSQTRTLLTKLPNKYSVTVFLSNKCWNNLFGHTYLKLEKKMGDDPSVETFLDTGLDEPSYDALINNPQQGLLGNLGVTYKVYLTNKPPQCQGDILNKTIELTKDEYNKALAKMEQLKDKEDYWSADNNCITPVVNVLENTGRSHLSTFMKFGGQYFRTPIGTVGRAMLADSMPQTCTIS